MSEYESVVRKSDEINERDASRALWRGVDCPNRTYAGFDNRHYCCDPPADCPYIGDSVFVPEDPIRVHGLVIRESEMRSQLGKAMARELREAGVREERACSYKPRHRENDNGGEKDE